MRPNSRLRLAINFLVTTTWVAGGPALSSDVGHDAAAAQEIRSRIGLYTTTVTWTAAPYTPVTVELHGPGGLKASGAEVTDNARQAHVRLVSEGRPEDAVIVPGDMIVVRAGATPGVTLTVPSLAAEFDESADRLVGIAPPGAGLELDLDIGDAVATGEVTADDEGRFAFDLPPDSRLAEGDFGHARFLSDTGDEFTATAAAFRVTVTVGREELQATVGAGGVLVAEVNKPGGTDWSATLVPVRPFVLSSTLDVRMPGLPHLVAGSELRLTRLSPVPGFDETLTVTIPELSVPIGRHSREIDGSLPPGAAAIVELGDALAGTGYRPTVQIPVIAEMDGTYSALLPTGILLEPGWRAQLRYVPQPKMELVAESVLRHYRLVWRGTEVLGVVNASVPVSVTLISGVGAVKGTAVGHSGSDGKFSVKFGAGSQGDPAVLIMPGDRVTVEETLGDPIVIDVPDFTVVTDAVADRVYGQALPGMSVAVSASSAVVVQTVADGTGRYAADFAGARDIAPGDAGGIAFKSPEGREFVTGWSSPRLGIELSGLDDDGNFVLGTIIDGVGTPGRNVRATARSALGRLAAHETLLDRGGEVWASTVAIGSRWQIALRDWTGAGIELRAGDTLEVESGDDLVAIIIPRLEATVDVDADRVVGRSEPGTEITCGARRNGASGSSRPIAATVDAMGNFTCDFGGTYDVQYRDSAFVTALIDGAHRVTRMAVAPGLHLDLNASSVAGTVSASLPIRVELMRDHAVVWAEDVIAGPDGTFEMTFRSAGGDLLAPRAGDEVVVRDLSGSASTLVTMTVPELSIEIRREEALVRGRATPGGALGLYAFSSFSPQGQQAAYSYGWAIPGIGPDGDFEARTADFEPPGIDLRPGTDIRARYRLPAGHMVTLFEPVPMINVRYGGPNVCGRARGGAALDIRLFNASGALKARAAGNATADRRFALTLSSPDGEPVAVGPGDRLVVDTPRETFSVDVPPLSIAVDWTGYLSGRGAPFTFVSGAIRPLTTYYIETPADDCFGGVIPYHVYAGDTARDGRFSAAISPPKLGEGIQVAFFTADWHRIYTQVYRAQAQIYVHTDRIAGLATPASEVAFTLTDRLGVDKVRSEIAADMNGLFDTRLRGADGEPAVVLPGERLSLTTEEGAVEIEVEELTFDFSSTHGLVGRTAPNRELAGRFFFPGGAEAEFHLDSDADGRIAFAPSDLPDRSPWSLADAHRVRLTLPVAGGHEIVAESANLLPPSARASRVFVPLALRRR